MEGLRRTIQGNKDVDGAQLDPRLYAVDRGIAHSCKEGRVVDDAVEDIRLIGCHAVRGYEADVGQSDKGAN